MKNALQNITLVSGRINSQHIRLFWLVLSVGLFILGAAAPGGDGGGHVGG